MQVPFCLDFANATEGDTSEKLLCTGPSERRIFMHKASAQMVAVMPDDS